MKLIQKKNKSLQPPRKAPTTTTSNLAQTITTNLKVSIFSLSPGSDNTHFNRQHTGKYQQSFRILFTVTTEVSINSISSSLGHGDIN